MLYSKVVLNLMIIWSSFLRGKSSNNDLPFNEKLITSLRNDANLDLPVDEEYEDLRAELLAYHTALATLSDTATRRSMKSSACWKLGGICINYKLCEGYKYISEVPGCKDKLTVCCFAWNKYHVRDLSDYGVYNIAFPWGHPQEFGGKGVLDKMEKKKDKKSKNKKNKKQRLMEKLHNSQSSEFSSEEKKLKGKLPKSESSEVSSKEKELKGKLPKVESPEVTSEEKEPKGKLLKVESTEISSKLEELKGKIPKIGSPEVTTEETKKKKKDTIKRSLDLYYNVFPWNEFGENTVIEIEPEVLQETKESLIEKDMSDNEFQKKSSLHDLRSRLPFLLVSLDLE